MSQCMTIADETIDQKDTSAEVAPKDIVEFILEETLLSVFIISDKDCRLIGDFNQQYDRLSYLRDFEQVESSQNQSGSNQESNLDSGENIDRFSSLATAKENLEIIIDRFIRKEEKIKLSNECTIITEEVLADNELQIKNGQIHLERNKADKIISEPENQEYFDKKDIIKNDKIEIEYYNEGKLNKIYVPLNSNSNSNIDCAVELEQKEEKNEDNSEEKEVNDVADESDKVVSKKDIKRPFEPFTTEELRQSTLQVWENSSSSLVGKWNGDVLAQREEVVRLMEELSSVQVFSENISDPNRPRAYAFAEEDVKKMTKEIEEISFTQSRANSDDLDMAYLPDGQGDADLESKSFTKSKDNMEKPQEEFYTNSLSVSKSNTERKSDRSQDQEREGLQSQSKELSKNIYAISLDMPECFTSSIIPAGSKTSNKIGVSSSLKPTKDRVPEEHCIHSEKAEEEESLLKSNLYNESTIQIRASLNQVSHSNFSRDRSPEKINEMKENLFCATCLISNEDIQKTGEVLQTNSINLKEFQNGRNLCDEFFPESVSLSESIRSLGGNKQDEYTLKNLELSSELDLKLLQEKSDTPIGSRSVNNAPELTYSIQKSTISLERPNFATSETHNTLNQDSFFEETNLKISSAGPNLISKKIGKKADNNDSYSFAQEPDSQFDKLRFEILQNGENSNLIVEKINKTLEEAFVCNEKNLENLQEKVCNAENRFFETQTSKNQISINDSNSMLTQNKPSAHESSSSLNSTEETFNTETNKEPSVSPQTLSETEDSKESLNESEEFSENPEASDTNAPKFKLHSQKMYFGADYDPAGQTLNEFTLLESEETFIDLTESVIQVIEPPETSANEDGDKISFSLLFEMPNQKTPPCDNKSDSELPSEENLPGENEICSTKTYSGMTTVGPLKNFDYDSKSLIAPEIDYGKMTRITSSRQLAKDMSLFSSDVNTGISVKIIEEDDSDDDTSLNVEEDHLDRNSLLNRDIASLTKVQKVREVMSYQPKSEEDFEDEDVLPRSRLDLKDVESMTDERYKMPDVSIPLLSFEIDHNNIDAGKELIESMGLVISGLTNPAYYEEEIEEASTEIQKSQFNLDKDSNKATEFSNKSLVLKKSSKILAEDTEEGEISISGLKKEIKSRNKVESTEKLAEENELDENLRTVNSNSQNESGSNHMKYSTLGNVFKKASNKILRKDVDLFMRNSKSLPRDTSKICTTDSIRSILDDCQSSASNILKKSRSLLKNTQSIFRSISQSRMSSDRNHEQNAGTSKLSPSESDVTTMQKKFPSCLKTEYFTKNKISIKNMPEKTIVNSDITSSTSCEREIPSEEKILQISDRNEENLRIDGTENFKKLLSKNPLIYKSQFVKSQMSFQSETPEPAEVALKFMGADNQQNIANTSVHEGNTEKIADEATEPQMQANPKEICIQEKLQWVSSTENLYSLTSNESEPRQLGYIVMETIQGLPHADLESPSSEKENLNVENNGNIKVEKENDTKKIEASNSLQIFTDGNRDVAPCFPEVDEEKMATKTPSERKIKAKKKKFTARFRSFWCSAFGRVKTQPKKGDLS